MSTATAEEQADLAALHELSRDILAAKNSAFEPGPAARAFAPAGPDQWRVSMLDWVQLSLARSPLLEGRRPETIEKIDGALRAFGVESTSAAELEPEDAAEIVSRMLDGIREMFSTILRMRDEADNEAPTDNEGFGLFLPLLTRLIVTCGLSRTEALATPVVQAWAIWSATKRNMGWHVSGTSYRLMDVVKTPGENGVEAAPAAPDAEAPAKAPGNSGEDAPDA